MATNKKINFYFHDDVDGLTCASLFLGFIRQRGYSIGKLIPMVYGGSLYSKWRDILLEKESVILDFRYHPSADWFFDHHTSSFMVPEWKEGFKSDNRHFFDENYPSCFGFVFDSLVKEYGFKPNAFMRKLRPEVDMLDAARYPSAKYYVLLEGAIARFDVLLEKLRKTKKIPHEFFIKSLSTKSISQILKIKKYARIISNLKYEIKRSLEKLPSVINIKSNVSIIDATRVRTHLPRYSDYYLYPGLEYSITIKKSKSVYSLSAGKNPWSEKSSALHLGKLQETFGGGGHQDAAGSECASYEEAVSRADIIRSEIIKSFSP